MTNENIRSLKKLKQRKERIKKELAICEEQITDDYLELTQPVTNFVSSIQHDEYNGDLPFDGIYKFALNAKRVVDMVRLGMSVYKDYRR